MKSMTAEQRNHMLLCDPVSRVIPKLAVPTIISMLITNIYNMADTFFVSQLGTSASGAVGVIFSAMAIIQAVSFMIGMGAGTHVSQALGAGNREKADAYASTSFFTAFIAGVILAFFSLTNIDAVVRFLGSTETIAPYAKDYATYIFYAMPFMMCSFVMNNLLRFEGLTMYGMVGITAGGILNIVLDPILIFGLLGFPRMEVAGAAVATITGQFIGAALGLVLNHTKNPDVQLRLSGIRPHRATVADIYAVGIPSIIMQSIGSVMMFGMNKILISFTEAATAVFGAYFKLQSFIFMPCFGLNNAMVPIVSYNYGAQEFDRVRKTVRLTVFTAIGIMCVGCALFELIPETLLGMFSPTDEMLSIGRVALRIIGVHFPLAGFSIIAGSACQALGKPTYALVSSVCRQIVVLLPAAYLLSLTGRLELVWLSFPIAEIVSVIMNAAFLKRTYRASLGE